MTCVRTFAFNQETSSENPFAMMPSTRTSRLGGQKEVFQFLKASVCCGVSSSSSNILRHQVGRPGRTLQLSPYRLDWTGIDGVLMCISLVLACMAGVGCNVWQIKLAGTSSHFRVAEIVRELIGE